MTSQAAIEAVWRIESARLIAGLARFCGSIHLAEDLAQDALVVALEKWPHDGIPKNPGAWLTAVAKRRAIDVARRDHVLSEKLQQISDDAAGIVSSAEEQATAENELIIHDDLLRLIFIACHPVLPPEARVALTLKMLGGLTTTEIARAFMVKEQTVAQRIVRAKRTLKEAHVAFELPEPGEFTARLQTVLAVIYLIFNEGYVATRGSNWTRPELCDDALRLGRVLAELTPEEPEVHGLIALMELHASRLPARIDKSGRAVLLDAQDRSLWDRLLIRRGVAALDRAVALQKGLHFYGLQAAIAACHAAPASAGQTDWDRILALYDALMEIAPSPVIELNRCVAIGRAIGPQAGLDALEHLRTEPALADHHLLASVRADLLARNGDVITASFEFQRAASLTANMSERALLLERASGLENPTHG